MATDTIACTKCGHTNPAGEHDCEQCGVTLQLVAAKQGKPTEEEPSSPKAEPAPPKNAMACPKCGQSTNALADDCMKCGVIFSKFFEAESQRLQEDPEAIEELEQLKQTMDGYHSLRGTSPAATEEAPAEKAPEEDTEFEASVSDEAQETAEINIAHGAATDDALSQLLRPKPNLQRLLKQYCDQTVGMNVESPTAIKDVRLVSANDDFFTVLTEDRQLVCSFPLANIVSITEAVDGVPAGPAKNQTQFPMIIRVSHRMV